MRRLFLGLGAVVFLAACLWFGARHEASSQAVPAVVVNANPAQRGAAAFLGADFGGLSLKALDSHAVPWKLVTAALVRDAVDSGEARSVSHDALNDVLRGFGFLVEARVENMPKGVSDAPGALPLGVTHGMISPLAGLPVQVANLGCASCHAGVTYKADGMPDPTAAWIGMPNSSLNLEAYTQSIFRTLKAYQMTPDLLMETVMALYPNTGWRERQTLRRLVLPMVSARLDQITDDRALPFLNGVPGSTNGVAALKHVFEQPLLGGGVADVGIVSIPDLGHRHWRSSLLVDGAYAIPQTNRQTETTRADNTAEKRAGLAAITTFFTVPSMGVHPGKAIQSVPVAEDIFAFLNDDYAPQPFPGVLEPDLARAGATIYAQMCSTCHGSYDLGGAVPELISLPNWLGDVGTDPLRTQSFTNDLVDTIGSTSYSDKIAVARTQAYAALPLSGLWASAPYLHNGSVPTIWHLLTPKARPQTFELGGHMLDFARLGVMLENGRYPENYVPFSTPVLLDTEQPGFGKAGHVFGAELSEGDKSALIEFLKQL